jgi:hypothetical protein
MSALGPKRTFQFHPYSAVAAVFVRKAALKLPHPLEVIANTFKLTPAEMHVLMVIVELGARQKSLLCLANLNE